MIFVHRLIIIYFLVQTLESVGGHTIYYIELLGNV